MTRAARFAALFALAALGACTDSELDCSLGAIRPTCPPGTLGFDRMSEALRLAQRACGARGLEPGTDAYAACIAARMGPAPRAPHAFAGVGPG